MPDKRLKIAVLISGNGTTLQHFIDEADSGALAVDIVQVISSRPAAGGLQRARQAGIPAQVVESSAEAAGFSQQISELVARSEAELVCMAGFLRMWIIPPEFDGRVMNVHPALLPAFGGKGYYGAHVHRAVIEAGCRISGCTVHFADNQYDHGPIILQRGVRVQLDDTPETLARRVMRKEKIAYPEAIRLFADGRLRIDGRRVMID
jgi:formyltetrahydrofolate-dependent phosphoribosylglycinamide formyltransferase